MQYIYISIFKVSKHNINVCIDLYSFRLSSRPYIRKLNTVNIQYFPCWNAAFFLRQRNGEVIFYISMLPPSVLNKCTCPAPYLYSSFLMHHKWPRLRSDLLTLAFSWAFVQQWIDKRARLHSTCMLCIQRDVLVTWKSKRVRVHKQIREYNV